MGQIGMAGVSASMPYVTGPSTSEVPTRRVQSQQSSRPVKESDETDHDSGDSSEVLIEDPSPKKHASNSNEESTIVSDNDQQLGEKVDIRI